MKVRMSEAMSRKVLTVTPEDSIMEAYLSLKENRVRHLVVIDEDDYVVGVISDRDFQRAMVSHVEQAGSMKMVEEYFNPEHQVQDFMSWDVQAILESDSLKHVALRMLEKKISSLVVVNDKDEMVGFITSDDLLWVLVKLIDEQSDDEFLLDLKAQVLNSPLGAIVNSLSQVGI